MIIKVRKVEVVKPPTMTKPIGAQLAARAVVIADVPAGSVEFGFPAKPRYRALAELAMLGYLTDNRRVLKKFIRQATPK